MAISESGRNNEKTCLKIVSVDEIPKSENVLFDDLPKIYKTFLSMEDTCRVLQGIGLHAVQVGIPQNMYVICGRHGFEYYLNCNYKPLSLDKEFSFEGCLSFDKNRYFKVERYKKINIIGQQLRVDGKIRVEDINFDLDYKDGILCVAHQHEIDHANSILVSSGQEMFMYK